MLFDRPEDLELLAAFGLIFLLFYLGVEFSLDDLTGGGRLLLASAGLYLVLNLGAGLAFGFASGWAARRRSSSPAPPASRPAPSSRSSWSSCAASATPRPG